MPLFFLYSFFTFLEMNEVKEVVVVCDPFYKDIFEGLEATWAVLCFLYKL